MRRFAIALVLFCVAAVPARDVRGLADLWLAGERLFGPFEASVETRALLARVVADIRKLDLKGLYEALPDSARADGARLVVFAATRSNAPGTPRRLEHSALRSELSAARLFELEAGAAPLVPLGPAVGDGWLVGGALPLDAERLRVRTSAALRIGEADLTQVAASATDFLRRVEARAQKSERDALSATLAEDFPAAAAFLGRYFELAGRTIWADERLHFAPIVRVRRDALAADYALFARFLARATDVIRSRASLADESGTVVARWAFHGPEGLVAEADFRDGRLLPLGAEGASHDLTRPLRLRFTNDASIEALGLKTSITGIRGTMALDPEAARGATSVAGMPDDTGLDGALFGVLTPNALDALVPGRIEQILQDLLRSILEGRENRGVDLVVHAEPSDGAGHALRSELAADVSSARLVRIALAIGARWLYPDDAETADAKRFARDALAQLRRDALGDTNRAELRPEEALDDWHDLADVRDDEEMPPVRDDVKTSLR